MDGTILVVRAGHTPRQSVRAAAEKLGQGGIALLGAVLNDLDWEARGATYPRLPLPGPIRGTAARNRRPRSKSRPARVASAPDLAPCAHRHNATIRWPGPWSWGWARLWCSAPLPFASVAARGRLALELGAFLLGPDLDRSSAGAAGRAPLTFGDRGSVRDLSCLLAGRANRSGAFVPLTDLLAPRTVQIREATEPPRRGSRRRGAHSGYRSRHARADANALARSGCRAPPRCAPAQRSAVLLLGRFDGRRDARREVCWPARC